MQHIADDVRSIFDRHSETIGRVADAVAKLDDAERRDKQAMAGGCDDFESESALETHYSILREHEKPVGRASVESMERDYDDLLSGAFRVDGERVREMGAVLSLDNLTDDDLRRLATDNRHDYSALMAIANYSQGHKSTFAVELGRSLRSFVEQVGAAPGKIARYCSNGVEGRKNARYWRAEAEGRCQAVADAYDDMQAVIDGRTVERVNDPLLRAVSMIG